ncbi:MAG: TRZ/ATZ family hydrolase [Saccharospirillaceae bacterium]|nr:TRZ/ATZ family hydrolase [Pseudomonadales bacterium]NRB80148.1 TRZ/ATZ family hydrolase [Saccharospirillaceae bacterium]
MTQVDSIILSGFIVTVNPEFEILKNHCLVIHNGQILAILENDQTQYTSNQLIDRTEHIIMPGLINAHNHAAMTLLRGYADDMGLMTWLNEYIWPAEAKWVNDDFVYTGTQLAIAEMLKSGTTCFSDQYFFPLACAKAVDESGMRAQIAPPVIDFANNWAKDAQDHIDQTLALAKQYKNHERISIAFGPHAPYTVSDQPLTDIAALSKQQQLPVHIHIHETAFEVNDAVEKLGKRPLARLHELGLLNKNLQAVHMTQLNDDEIQLLVEHQVSVVHCPQSNLKLASGICPITALTKAGVNVCLGTDGAASNNDLDLFCEMRTAALLAKGTTGDPTSISAEQAIKMATINGAKALGLSAKIGSLEVGKQADFCIIECNHLNTSPMYNVASSLVYSTNSAQVSDVYVNGVCLLQDKQLLSLDETSLMQQAKQWQLKISQTSST